MPIDLSAVKGGNQFREVRPIKPVHFPFPFVGGSAARLDNGEAEIAAYCGGMSHRMALARDFMVALLENAKNEAIPHSTLAAGSVALADALIAALGEKPSDGE